MPISRFQYIFLTKYINLFSNPISGKLSTMIASLTNPDQWVDLYGDSLFSFTLKFISQTDVAQNLVQETFLAALQNRSSFKGNSSEKTWLIGILKNKITDHLRLKYREVPASQIVEENMHIEDFFDNADLHSASWGQ
jgi:RNA polymerase sigma factor (sigma-70 family)